MFFQTDIRFTAVVCTEHRWPSVRQFTFSDQITATSEQMLQRATVPTSTDATLAGTFLDGERLGKHEHRQLQFNDNVISFGVSPLKFKLIGEHPSELCHGPQLDLIRSVAQCLTPGVKSMKNHQKLKSCLLLESMLHKCCIHLYMQSLQLLLLILHTPSTASP